jgi:hypothetical protein
MTTQDIDLGALHATERELESLQELRNFTAQAAYGFTPKMAKTVFNLLVSTQIILFPLIIGCISAVGNIKENMALNDIMRQLQDVFDLTTSDKASGRPSVNFSAVRMVGMIFCALLKDEIPAVKRISEKHGNPFVEGKFPDTEGGKINKELYDAFPTEEWKINFATLDTTELISVLVPFYSGTAGFSSDAMDSIQKKLQKQVEDRMGN